MTEPRISAAAYRPGQGNPVPRHRRNPRRANDRDGRKFRLMDLANALARRVKTIRAIYPPPCPHEGEVLIKRFPLEIDVPDAEMRCAARPASAAVRFK